jgi:hypothetical protein
MDMWKAQRNLLFCSDLHLMNSKFYDGQNPKNRRMWLVLDGEFGRAREGWPHIHIPALTTTRNSGWETCSLHIPALTNGDVAHPTSCLLFSRWETNPEVRRPDCAFTVMSSSKLVQWGVISLNPLPARSLQGIWGAYSEYYAPGNTYMLSR